MPEKNLPESKADGQISTGEDQKIIVIGASSGGFTAIKTIVKNLPADFNASIFIVWHMASDLHGVLPQVLSNLTTIYSAHAYDKEPIKPNRIYIARPDHHLLIEEGIVRVTHGPKENRFRPAVDPLFRSAAYTYGNRVIGVVLSGALDDGTAGLWTVKQYGGIAVVQDPRDAEVPSMPQHALNEVKVDYSVTVDEMADLLVKLSKERPPKNLRIMKDDKTKTEIQIAAEETALKKGILDFGQLTPFACPECHGVLSAIKDGNIERYRCHTGHAYSVDALLSSLSEKVEDSLYSAIRGMDEIIMLLNHIGDHYAEINQSKLAAVCFQKAKETELRSNIVREAVLNNEHLSKESLWQEVKSK